MKKVIASTLFALAAATLSSSVLAGDWYGMVSAGRSDFKGGKSDLDNILIGAGATGLSSRLDDTDTGYKVQLGYRINQNFAVEGGYLDLGKMKYTAAFTGGAASAEAKADGWNIALVGSVPVGQNLSLFAKLGMIDAKVKVNVSATGPGGAAAGSADDTSWKGNYGIGASYALSDKWAVRAEYERFNDLGDSNTGKGDVDLFSVGVVFKF